MLSGILILIVWNLSFLFEPIILNPLDFAR